MSRLLTIADVCEQLHVTRKTVTRLIGSGQLKAFKLGAGGRVWRIRERDLDQFIRGQQAKS